MKPTIKIMIMLGLVAIVMMGCQIKPNLTNLQETDPVMNIKAVTSNAPVSYPIWAGQNINVGTMDVSNDAQYLYVTYNVKNGWMLTETHLHVASTLAGIPKNKQGIPVPGQFQYATMHNPPVTTYTYNILLADHGFTLGQELFVAAHAVVVNGDYPSGIFQRETGWGGNTPGPGPRWWFYFNYTLVDDILNEEDPEFNVTTAMMRMNDSPTDFTYKWGTHPWFSYVKNIPTMNPSKFYFYAAQHYRVGEVEIWKDNSFLYVEINMDAPYEMAQSHLNVKLTGYSGSPSFGLFPYTMSHNPRVTGSYLYQIPWQSAWDNNELNIALHGEVGPF
jgi:hypothetical protein